MANETIVPLEKVKKARSIIESTVGGDIKIFNAAEENGLDIGRKTSGSYKLDKIMGGGYPEGRIIEIYGAESSGKTSTTTIAAAAYTQAKRRVFFVDAEQSYDLEYAKKIGIDPEYFDIVQPNNGEQAFMLAQGAVESGVYDLVIIDSVSALIPKAILENTAEDVQKIGILATLMAQNIPRLNQALSKSKASVIFINQVRSKISTGFSGGYGPQTTTTGGHTLKFFSSIRLEVKKGMPIKRGDERIGNEMKVTTVKNKTFPPMKTAIVNLMFDEKENRWGTDAWSEIFDEIVEKDLLGSRGKFISLTGEVIRKEKLSNMEEVPYLKEYLDTYAQDDEHREEMKKELTELKGVSFLRIYLQEHPEQFDFVRKRVEAGDFSEIKRDEEGKAIEFNNEVKEPKKKRSKKKDIETEEVE